MAAADDAVIMKFGAYKYNFSPANIEYIGQRYEENEAVGVAESGKVKVATLAASPVRFLEFRIQSIPSASRTYNTLTVQGWAGLLVILNGLHGKSTTLQLKLAGAVDDVGLTNYLTVRYWSGAVTEQTEGQSYSGKLTFRVEAA